MAVFLNTKADLEWLAETHLRGVDISEYRSAMLHGNEDCPAQIEFWHQRNPHYQAKPAFSWKPTP
jgi:hypothetical protein